MKTNKTTNKVGQYNLSGFDVIISAPIKNDIDLNFVFNEFKHLVPDYYFDNLDAIYIGDFAVLKDRKINAMYDSGVFYISNVQDDEGDLIDDLVHETAHLVEDQMSDVIYSDGAIEKEFINKRRKLFEIIESEYGEISEVTYSDFLNTSFTRKFDDFLFNIISYPVLAALTINLFYSPYAATSIREYFANAFEAYYYKKDFNRIKSLSPILYNRIKLMEKENEYRYKTSRQ